MVVPSIFCQMLQLWGDVLITLIIARTKLPDKKKPKEGEGLICLTVSTYTLSWQAKECCSGQLLAHILMELEVGWGWLVYFLHFIPPRT